MRPIILILSLTIASKVPFPEKLRLYQNVTRIDDEHIFEILKNSKEGKFIEN